MIDRVTLLSVRVANSCAFLSMPCLLFLNVELRVLKFSIFLISIFRLPMPALDLNVRLEDDDNGFDLNVGLEEDDYGNVFPCLILLVSLNVHLSLFFFLFLDRV